RCDGRAAAPRAVPAGARARGAALGADVTATDGTPADAPTPGRSGCPAATRGCATAGVAAIAAGQPLLRSNLPPRYSKRPAASRRPASRRSRLDSRSYGRVAAPLFEVEQRLARVGALHALLVVLLPDLRPRAAEHVRHLVPELRARRQRRRDAVHREQRLNAFDVRVRGARVERRALAKIADDPHRLGQGLRVVAHAVVLEARAVAVGVPLRRVDLDRLHLVRGLERAVRGPRLDVRRPGDQRVAVPEADRLAVPARHVGAQARYGAVHVELAADVHLRDEVAGDAGQDLHEIGRDQHLTRIDAGIHRGEIP